MSLHLLPLPSLSMRKTSILALRTGLAITFIVVGVYIWLHPTIWYSMLLPWAKGITVGGTARPILQAVAIFDIFIGILFLLDLWTWIVALIASVMLVLSLAATGVSDATVRDIGLLGASLALLFATMPEKTARKMRVR